MVAVHFIIITVHYFMIMGGNGKGTVRERLTLDVGCR